MARFLCGFVLLSALLTTADAMAGAVLDAVKARQSLNCGIHADAPGLAWRLPGGDWRGFEADICRALAAAVLGDADKVSFVALTRTDAAPALDAGRVDVLALRPLQSPASGADDTRPVFAALALVNSLGLMVAVETRIANALELAGKSICLGPDARTLRQIESLAAARKIALDPLIFETPQMAAEAFFRGACAALADSRLTLAGLLLRGVGDPANYEILPEVLSRDQFGPTLAGTSPAVDDRDWYDIVRWSVYALIEAEERGISSRNVEALLSDSKDPRVRRFLGLEGNLGATLGLKAEWARSIVEQVGNYAEIYDRNLGKETAAPLPRGPNALWLDGGVLQAPAFQ